MLESTSACWANVGETWKFWSSGKFLYVICTEDLEVVAFFAMLAFSESVSRVFSILIAGSTPAASTNYKDNRVITLICE